MLMEKGGGGLSHLTPLERAIEYIETHLDENIDLGDVSREMGYSYYHMTRMFSAVLGEPVGRYISRRRLYRAARQLVHSDRRIIDIALESGFQSPEAFSRAFKAAFKTTPADYRKAGLDLVATAKPRLLPVDVPHIAAGISHSPEILQMTEEIKIAGLRGATSISQNRIPQLWDQFLRHHRNLYELTGTAYSICETRQTVYAEDGDVTFSVMVGSPVPDFSNLPETLAQTTLRPGKYAVFTHRGSLDKLLQTYQYIYGTWLPSSGQRLDEREDFEVYERKVLAVEDPENEVKLYIPVL